MSDPRRRPDPRHNHLPETYQYVGFIAPALRGDDEQVRQIIAERARAADELLQSRAFQIVFHEMRTAMAEEIINSKPGQAEQREDAYYRIRGLEEIIMRLKGMVNKYNTLVQREASEARGPL